MELKIIKQEKNPFLKREEITVEITSKAAPSHTEVIAALGKDEALTVVKKINTNFGRQTFLTQIVVYDNIEAREEVETIPQKIKKKMEAEKKAAVEAAKKKAEEEAKAEEEEAKKAEEEKPSEEEKTAEVKEEEKSE